MSQNNLLQSIQEQLAQVEEGDIYSKDVRTAIEIVSTSQTMAELHAKIIEHPGLDMYNLLYRRADRERQSLGTTQNRLRGLKNLPSMDVDFI